MRVFSVFKHVSLYGLAKLGAFILTILLLSYYHGHLLHHQIQSILKVDCSSENTVDNQNAQALNEIRRVIDMVRTMVHKDMAEYQYPNGKYNISASKLEDLVLENNGQPVRSIILATWRSGSSFTGEIIGSHPGNFQHFEPLRDLSLTKVRGPPAAENALNRLKALLNCDFTNEQDKSIVWHGIRPDFFRPISYLWRQCEANSTICFDHRYLSAMCRLFPFQSMKLLRVNLNVAQELLADEKLAVRLVMLIRDPRGIIQSRKLLHLCRNEPDCSEPALLCADMILDYKIAAKLLKKYPDTFRVIRYEDLAADPYGRVKDLFEFYGRDFDPKVEEYLDTHTKIRSGDLFSTFRNTETTPYHWRAELEFEEVQEIQQICALAMKYWGYLPAMNATHQKEFNPITNYSMSL